MIFYKKEKVEQKIFYKFICDKCGNEIIGEVELQETFSINFIGGYSSVFGDGNEISCDLCQDCLQELIGSFCKCNGEGNVIYNKVEVNEISEEKFSEIINDVVEQVEDGKHPELILDCTKNK